MKYDFDQVVDRSNTYSFKYDVTKIFWPTTPDNNIPMSLADMDFVSPKPIVDAMHRVADFNLYAYCSDLAAPSMKEAIKRWWRDKYNVNIETSWFKYVGAVMDGIACAIETFSNVGDGVIVQHPVYSNFMGTTIYTCHRQITSNHLIETGLGQYEMNFEELERLCADPHNRIMILCNPQNPIGRIWTYDELAKVCEITRKYNVLLLVDEIHADIRRKGKEMTSIFNATGDYSNIIEFGGINKTFNCAGLKGGFALIPDNFLRARFNQSFGMVSPTAFCIAAIEAGYNEGDEWLEQVNEYIDGNFEFVKNFMAEKMPWAKVYIPDATYTLWVDFSACGLPGDEIMRRIYIDAAVRGGEGTKYDPTIDNSIQRFCIPFPRSIVKEAFERISAAFSDIEV